MAGTGVQASDYHLESLPNTVPSENLFYIVSPKDVVEGRPCDIDDHIAWLLEHKKYVDADRRGGRRERATDWGVLFVSLCLAIVDE